MSLAVLRNQVMYNIIPTMIETSGTLHYLGMIKNKKHYLNTYNEVYMKTPYGQLEYTAEWLPEYKMLWVDYPHIIYKSVTIQQKDYFYDIYNKDAYIYDENQQIVKYVGNYCHMNHFIYTELATIQ